MIRRHLGPRIVVPVALVAAGVTVASGRQTWLHGRVEDGDFSARATAAGTAVVPGLVALALVVAAAAVAAATAGLVVRRLTLAVGAGAAFALATLSIMVPISADRLLGGVAAAASGRTGTVDASASASFWPYAVFAATVVATAVLVAGFVGARGWRGLSDRYDPPADPEAASGGRGERVASTWDRLDHGDDPTADG